MENLKNSLKDSGFGEIYSLSFVLVLIISLILFSINIIFLDRVWWIPITLAFGSIWITYWGICYYIFIDKKRKNIDELEIFAGYLCHYLGNSLWSIAMSRKRIKISMEELEENLLEECERLSDESLDKIEIIWEHPILEKRKKTEILNSRVILAN